MPEYFGEKEELNRLKEEVYNANMKLKEYNLVILTWGNVSGISQNREYIVIKPSGVDYDKLKPEDMVAVNMRGEVIYGDFKPSSDTPTHLELYKAYKEIGGVCHTHSLYATSYAQSYYGRPLEAVGTTHADYFDGAIPVTRPMKKDEIALDYEKNTGLVIVETLQKIKKSPTQMPAVFVKSHGPFTFGKDCGEAVEHSLILENITHLSFNSKIFSTVENFGHTMPKELLRKHFDRKHGKNAYYGQDKNK